jgi:hypothetical protein
VHWVEQQSVYVGGEGAEGVRRGVEGVLWAHHLQCRGRPGLPPPPLLWLLIQTEVTGRIRPVCHLECIFYRCMGNTRGRPPTLEKSSGACWPWRSPVLVENPAAADG